MSDAALYDLKGLKCPLPVLKTRRRLADMQRGDELCIETTDPLAVIDVPHFCAQDGHALVETVRLEDGHRFRIRKG